MWLMDGDDLSRWSIHVDSRNLSRDILDFEVSQLVLLLILH